LISPDALALVRFGLRAADDPRIVDTVKAIDAVLKADLPQGPVWVPLQRRRLWRARRWRAVRRHRHRPAWPLLTGERAHYELAAGRVAAATAAAGDAGAVGRRRRAAAGTGVDRDDVPGRELFAAGLAAAPCRWSGPMPSTSTAAVAARRAGVRPAARKPVRRYQVDKVVSPVRAWRFNQKRRALPAGKGLRIELPAQPRCTGPWTTGRRCGTTPPPRLRSACMSSTCDRDGTQRAARIRFTFLWRDAARWEGADFTRAWSTARPASPPPMPRRIRRHGLTLAEGLAMVLQTMREERA